MSNAIRAIVLVSLISLIVHNCQGTALDPKLNGRIIVSVFTAYNKNGSLKLDVVPQQAEFFAQRNIKNVQILAFYGQGPTIPLELRIGLIKTWVQETDRLGLNLIVEIGAMPFPDQLELAKYCSQLNISAISAFPLSVYEAQTTEEIIEDYRRLSDAAPNLPLLYRDVSETAPEIIPPAAVVAAVGKVKTFIGGVISLDAALDVAAAVPSVDGYFRIIFGNRAIAAALLANMNASVTNIVNLCPKLALAIEAAVDARNIKEALDLQQQGNRLVQAIVCNDGKVIDFNSRPYFRYLRAAYRILRNIDLGERLPFEKVTSAELDRIRSNLEKYQDFINCYCN